MVYQVPTGSDARYKAIMRFLDKIQTKMLERSLNATEYSALTDFKLKINSMRFGTPPELEYPHWAELFNRLNGILDQPRRVPIAGGAPSERREHRDEENIVQELYREEFDDYPIPDHSLTEEEANRRPTHDNTANE